MNNGKIENRVTPLILSLPHSLSYSAMIRSLYNTKACLKNGRSEKKLWNKNEKNNKKTKQNKKK